MEARNRVLHFIVIPSLAMVMRPPPNPEKRGGPAKARLRLWLPGEEGDLPGHIAALVVTLGLDPWLMGQVSISR